VLFLQQGDELVRETAGLAVAVEYAGLDLQDLHTPSNGQMKSI
jgi:hypothetical protein